MYRWKEYHGLRPERRRCTGRAALETVSKAAELAKANGEEVIAVVFGKDTDTKTVITAGELPKVLVAGEEGLPAGGEGTDPRKRLRRNISRRQSIWQEPRGKERSPRQSPQSLSPAV